MNRSLPVVAVLIAAIAGAILFSTLTGQAQESRSERVARIEGLSIADKSELNNKLDRFFKLSDETQQQLAELDQELRQHPNEAALRNVMQRYYTWLKTLNPVDRAKLQELPTDQRVTEIKRLIALQEREQFEHLSRDVFRDIIQSREEFSTIRSWLEQWLASHQEEILGTEQQIYDKVPWLKDRLEDAPHERKVFVLWAWMYRVRGVQPLNPTDAEFQELAGRLTEDTQKRLKAQPLERQKSLLRDVMGAAVVSHFHSRIDDDDLQKFYRRLPEQKQAELAALPPDAFDRALRSEYMKNNFRMMGGRPPGPPPWGREGRDGRRGDGRPGDGRPGDSRSDEGRPDPGRPDGLRGDEREDDRRRGEGRSDRDARDRRGPGDSGRGIEIDN